MKTNMTYGEIKQAQEEAKKACDIKELEKGYVGYSLHISSRMIALLSDAKNGELSFEEFKTETIKFTGNLKSSWSN